MFVPLVEMTKQNFTVIILYIGLNENNEIYVSIKGVSALLGD